MSDRLFLDTNIIVYAFSDDGPRREIAQALLAAGGQVSVQVLNEFVAVSRRKLGRSWSEITEALDVLDALLQPARSLTPALHRAAIDLAQSHGFSIYDSLIVAAATEAGCSLLLSEDLQDGRTIGALTIRNPFAA